MINILVIDDNQDDINNLTQSLNQYMNQYSIDSHIDAYTSYRDIDFNKHYDISFLDIDMPDINGFMLSKSLESLIVFVTNRDDLVFDSFDFHPFAFIRKYLLDQEINHVLGQVIKEIKRHQKRISIQTNQQTTSLLLDDIIYIESYLHYCYIYTIDNKIKVRTQLSELLKQLDDDVFYQTHQSYIVSFKYVKKIDHDSCFMINDIVVPISQRKRKDTKISFQKYIARGI